ncbi:multimerin-2-like [Anarrhichthys ocellatus]|uniref:multimerin-2-like n=1 Tax=Anarrhichthys ocellatus TaxID=433405 RepID=UPI0012EE22A1|nr:multimerin-2-like [Anarrhichthys ocellatus]
MTLQTGQVKNLNLSLKMVTMVVFLLAFVGAASSELPHRRRCDPEQGQETPTLCSNYKNILHLDDVQTKLGENQMLLRERIDAMEGRTRLQLDSANGNISALQRLVNNVSNAQKDLERMASQTEMELRNAKTKLKEQEVDIASLKREVAELVKHGERVGGNISEIEERLDTTERQLTERKEKLENLESETGAAFNATQKLLNLYKKELSHLNSTARELEVKVEALLKLTETPLEANLTEMQNDSEEPRTEENQLSLEVTRLTAEVNAKVAFSATIIESNDTFTGPGTNGTTNILIYNRVFTNVGFAYNCKTGIFTARLKGVYHFSFMTFGYNGHTSGAVLVKNRHYQVSTWEFTGSDNSDTTSNTVILELNFGETVNVILRKGGKIHKSVFSGFLIFPTL